jgi:hypothetical protein
VDRERDANRLCITHAVKRSAAKPSASPATLKVTGSVNICRPHAGQHRAKHKTRTRDLAKLRMPDTGIEFPLLGGAPRLRPPAALEDAQINPICFARAVDRRDHRDVDNGGYACGSPRLFGHSA